MNTNISSYQILLKLTDCLFYFIQIKVIMLKDLNLKDITDQKILSRITTLSSMEKKLLWLSNWFLYKNIKKWDN